MKSYRSLNNSIITTLLITCLTACAVVTPLTGGDRDRTKPQLEYSLPGKNATNVEEQKLSFYFDEEIALTNFHTNVVINPYYSSRNIKTFVKGKKLTLTFLEPLDKNTTYNIDFGKSIIDVTEKNIGQDINYTFSTGPLIDTLGYSGVVLSNKTHKPIANALVTLRNKGEQRVDSINPIYTTKTDLNGKFKFHGLASKEFSVHTYQDLNNNKLYDESSEIIGILPYSINSIDNNADTLFTFKARLNQTKIKAPSFGENYMDISFTSGIKEVISTSEKNYHIVDNKKTIRYYAPENTTEISITALDSFNLKLDTTILYNYRPAPITEKSIAITGSIDRELNSTIENYSYTLSYLIDHIDTSKITQVINGDTVEITSTSTKIINNKEANKLTFITDYQLDTIKILLDTQAIVFKTGHYNLPNKISYVRKKESSYGSLTADITTAYKNYVFYVTNTENKLIHKETNPKQFKLEYLTPGAYKIHVLIDNNKNETYDTGTLRTQPESYYIYNKPIDIKANWEIGNIHIKF